MATRAHPSGPSDPVCFSFAGLLMRMHMRMRRGAVPSS